MGTAEHTGFLLICLVAIAQSDLAHPSEYVRPPSSKDLGLRPLEASLGPHFPQQVHLALAGQGRVAVSWVTHPQVIYRTNFKLYIWDHAQILREVGFVVWKPSSEAKHNPKYIKLIHEDKKTLPFEVPLKL